MSKKISELASATTPLAGTETVEIVQAGVSKKVAVSYFGGSGGGREVLSANRTYYVRADGSDSNNGLANTSGGAFLTIQKAIDVAVALDLSIYAITIQVADGTYTGANILKPYIGVGPITINGNNTTPTNVVISTTSATCFYATDSLRWLITNLKMTAATSGGAIQTNGNSMVQISGVDFGASVSSHMTALTGSSITAHGNYTVSGGSSAGGHAYATGCSKISTIGITVTLSGTPSIHESWVWCDRGLGYFDMFGMTFSGTGATGKRYIINMGGVCFINGGGANYFPGSIAGTTATGGQYA